MASHGKGRQFEQQIGIILAELQTSFPVRFKVTRQPRIELQSGEVVIPDFEIEIDLPHVHSKYLIECQDRQRNSKTILHKIQHVRAKSSRNKFVFVYNEGISQETARALNTEGIIVLSWEGFTHFVNQVRHTLEVTPPPYFGGCGGCEEWGEEVEEQEEE